MFRFFQKAAKSSISPRNGEEHDASNRHSFLQCLVKPGNPDEPNHSQTRCVPVGAGRRHVHFRIGQGACRRQRARSKIKRTGATAPAAEAALPECLEKLKLSQPQQTEVRDILQKYDGSINAVWKQFGEKYMAQVQTEVALLATIEDHLTEAQRTTVRSERRRVAHDEQAMEGTKSKPNQAKDTPADAAEQTTAGAGITLTSEQEATAETIHAKYVGRLRSLNRDIQGLHTRLVSLEADKLVEIEKILTKEQLVQLRESRLNVPAGANVTSAK